MSLALVLRCFLALISSLTFRLLSSPSYAGGVPIEIASGTAGLAYSYYIGHRRGYLQNETLFKPHNVSHVVLGTVLLWVGWLGFNGGSTFAANLRAAMAIFTTNLAGATGGLTWMLLDFRLGSSDARQTAFWVSKTKLVDLRT